MKSKEFNGHTNYETWLMAVWLDNHDCEAINEKVNGAERDPHRLASIIEDWVQDEIPDCDDPWAGFLAAAISEVDWLCVAEHLVERVKEADESIPEVQGEPTK